MKVDIFRIYKDGDVDGGRVEIWPGTDNPETVLLSVKEKEYEYECSFHLTKKQAVLLAAKLLEFATEEI